MKSFTRTTRRAVLVSCVAGAAVIGAVGVGTAAFADGTPAPGTSQTASTTETGPVAGPEHGKHEPHIGGSVLTVSGSTVTVQDPDGFTRTVTLADGVTVTKDDAASTTAAITKGAHIEATGTVASDGTTLTATAVRIGMPTPPKGGPAGPGGPGEDGGKHGRGTAPTPPTGAATPPTGAATPPTGAPTAAPTPSATS